MGLMSHMRPMGCESVHLNLLVPRFSVGKTHEAHEHSSSGRGACSEMGLMSHIGPMGRIHSARFAFR